jgi:hypothetical protein
LSKDEEDGQISRELVAQEEDGVASDPLVRYKVAVTTGDRRGAGTDANVFITIFGENGDSGEQKLSGARNCFERNKTDVFGVECVDLGKIRKIRIGHDGTGFGAAWFLDKVHQRSDTVPFSCLCTNALTSDRLLLATCLLLKIIISCAENGLQRTWRMVRQSEVRI